ncbi:aldehyde dehydrogenase family protein [Frankia gtarii]|uniref:aldehyde dehydrogenase family protein n=1 Tax=Frankia gtarii TaxID=2950102 RepID=UPI0021BEFDB8|nr:aldehyde dehydrogenase family protein [Frankia gtarii]
MTVMTGADMIERDSLFIDGGWRASAAGRMLDVHGAATGKVLGRVPDGTAADVDLAVAAARRAFPTWSGAPLEERLGLLARVETLMAERVEDLARLISSEVGTPIKVSRLVQVGLPIRVLATYRELLPTLPIEERIGDSLVVREPIGVVAAITAWNYSLQQVVGKVGAALATGCTVVVKPSEVAPLSAFVFADLMAEAGFPPGVFNLLSGTAASVGEPLVAHPGVDMIHFTGSTAAGRRIGAAAAQTVKRVALELGGKSANIILDDADLAQAVKVGVANCFTNSGQTCTAWTRMLVPRDRLGEVEDLVMARLQGYRAGDPLEPSTNFGPLGSEAQQSRVREHIERALAEGARLLAGGTQPPPGAADGYFVAPTVFTDVRPDMGIAREEVFGPVLAIIPYGDEDEAVEIANASIYGLAGAVWSADPARAQRVARRLRTGQVDINGSWFNPLAPFGGYRQSGTGRELGVHGLLEFYELKSLQLGPSD